LYVSRKTGLWIKNNINNNNNNNNNNTIYNTAIVTIRGLDYHMTLHSHTHLCDRQGK